MVTCAHLGRRARLPAAQPSACPGTCFSQEERMAAGYLPRWSQAGLPWHNLRSLQPLPPGSSDSPASAS
ncbi:zinc finger protein 554 [Homo sapiens]|uniref:Zinc finger protein 554 n=1 Tax=Homo sapiens TaxID=9606 RepID=K7EIR8_HUMAN|nr:zinc finger protein 554 [Homo sapiens]KAI4039510.1 zinc finger protein 554 [Homo sapiens]